MNPSDNEIHNITFPNNREKKVETHNWPDKQDHKTCLQGVQVYNQPNPNKKLWTILLYDSKNKNHNVWNTVETSRPLVETHRSDQ